MSSLDKYIQSDLRFSWYDNKIIRPYVFVREDMRVENPGSLFPLSLFPSDPILWNPLSRQKVEYANQILNLESRAFSQSGMAMPRWVFYDCAIMPGFVAGFACLTEALPGPMKEALDGAAGTKWTPISLFIIIPTMREGEWFAHNLCSINSLISKEHKLYGLGFLTKAFGLWYANIRTCCGATQWKSPAVKLHTQYGAFELLTTFTPAHDYEKTVTYRVNVDPSYWEGFFNGQGYLDFDKEFEKTDQQIDPNSESSMKRIQDKIENEKKSFYLNPQEIRQKSLDSSLSLYIRKT